MSPMRSNIFQLVKAKPLSLTEATPPAVREIMVTSSDWSRAENGVRCRSVREVLEHYAARPLLSPRSMTMKLWEVA